ncbi:MAG TPA: SMP-30/gluconolactonase/LRE family protein [Acidimicrobiales bacterium]
MASNVAPFRINRRRFVQGMAVFAVTPHVLAACGGNDEDTLRTTTSASNAGSPTTAAPATDRRFTVLAEGGKFFECPRWHDGRWWVSDLYRHGVFTYSTDGREQQVAAVEHQPAGLGWMPDGTLLAVSMTDRRVLRRADDGTMAVHADLGEHAAGWANDMVVATDGGAWVGNFGFDPAAGEAPKPGALVRIEPDGSTSLAADGLDFPNGSVITPDGTTLVVGETVGSRYTAFTITPEGRLTDRRVWATIDGVFPDGCSLDAEGLIWAADSAGRRVVRVAEGQGVVDERPVPDGLHVYGCMLGGDDGRTLLACCAPDTDPTARSTTLESVLYITTVDVPHAGLP